MKINKEFRSPNHYVAFATPPKILVIHATAADTWNSTKHWFLNPQSKASSHYVIDKNGDIYQMVDESKPAWHAGYSKWKGKEGLNWHSIGIELVNDSHKPYPEAQIAAVIELSKDIMSRLEIDKEDVVRHSDISGYRGKTDPYSHFPWDRFKKSLTSNKMTNYDILEVIKEWKCEDEVKWAEEKKIISDRRILTIEQLKTTIMLHRYHNR